jgi:hypothetical protein
MAVSRTNTNRLSYIRLLKTAQRETPSRSLQVCHTLTVSVTFTSVEAQNADRPTYCTVTRRGQTWDELPGAADSRIHRLLWSSNIHYRVQKTYWNRQRPADSPERGKSRQTIYGMEKQEKVKYFATTQVLRQTMEANILASNEN